MLTQLTEIAQMVKLAPGARIQAMVHHQTSNAYPDYAGDTFVAELLVSTLSAGLAKCRSGYGDVVIVLPGHSESVADNTMLTNLVAGTRILGFGRGSAMPTFRWTATSSQWILNDADVEIDGLRLKLEGANGVVKALVWTATGCRLANCKIQVASGATAKATIALEVGSGAHELELENLELFGTATHNVTDCIKVVAAVNDLLLKNVRGQLSATADNGLVHFTAPALRVDIQGCKFYNTHTASTACIKIDDDIALDGFFTDCRFGNKNDGTVTAQGAVFGGTEALCVLSEVYNTDQPMKNGTLSPAAGT